MPVQCRISTFQHTHMLHPFLPPSHIPIFDPNPRAILFYFLSKKCTHYRNYISPLKRDKRIYYFRDDFFSLFFFFFQTITIQICIMRFAQVPLSSDTLCNLREGLQNAFVFMNTASMISRPSF